MRSLERNKRPLYYSNPTGEKEPILDDDGYETGDEREVFTDPVLLPINVSAASGAAAAEAFGAFTDYSRTLSTCDLDCPFKVGTRIWFNIHPPDPHNYIVTRVADSVNCMLYALKEVTVKKSAEQKN